MGKSLQVNFFLLISYTYLMGLEPMSLPSCSYNGEEVPFKQEFVGTVDNLIKRKKGFFTLVLFVFRWKETKV